MVISSRTPEGEPLLCPLCEAVVCVEPSAFFGDATCPRCGTLLWFLRGHSALHLFDHAQAADKRQRLLAFLADRLGLDPAELAANPARLGELEIDSIELAELIMELEDELDSE